MKHEEFMEIVRRHNKEVINPTTKGAIIRKKVLHENHTDDEWLELQRELREFIASKPSKEELAELQGCGEMLAMICSGIREEKSKSI